jgi:hypothetical protein
VHSIPAARKLAGVRQAKAWNSVPEPEPEQVQVQVPEPEQVQVQEPEQVQVQVPEPEPEQEQVKSLVSVCVMDRLFRRSTLRPKCPVPLHKQTVHVL